ncbi:DnaA ATPase domain-containing protein [Cognatiyoonia sp. IB215182]|uniref:DnaA ATPase domain-containing protein n=1 Tax=Cognatiyoonia sp. IB215182 TaxID=3097353 RepID=UPI002A0ABF0A|nr:DnaA/Hda family protein [Cognatiyoonia sp. IB215182]MDX8353714.1 DnaA/Hda family protein [Cognatiyoonia sp. IB215182]
MADQLSFDWPTGVALGADDFFVSDANAQAYAMVQAPKAWPDGKLVIVGPKCCGKSHLAGIFAEAHHALVQDAATLPADFQTDRQAVVVEDMETLPKASEEAMFHLHNHLRNHGGTLLLTAQIPPARWPIALPDLASRMQATNVVNIENPDDALLSALLMKLFADRQIVPKPSLITYLTARIERSFTAAADIVARLDDAALTEGHKINRALARHLLDNRE